MNVSGAPPAEVGRFPSLLVVATADRTDGRATSLAPRLVELLREAAQPVPAWLVGMSHIATARRREEEGAIAAGGGALTLAHDGATGDEAGFAPADSAFTALVCAACCSRAR